MGNIQSVNLKSEYFQIEAGNLALASLEEKKNGLRFSRFYLNQIINDIENMDLIEVSALVDYYTWINKNNSTWIRNYVSMPIDIDLSGYKLASQLGNFAFLYSNVEDPGLEESIMERYKKLLKML
jgi:hypothetical protein